MARPKNFDQHQVMANAMQAFWLKGYQATSMKDLELATGLKPSSFYNTFGSKEDFFLMVLDYYSEKVVGARMERYLKQADPIKGIKDFFTTCFTDLPRGSEGIACLLVNSMSEIAIHHDGIRKVLNQNEVLLRANFLRCVEQAQQEKRISNQHDSGVLADQLLITLNGLLVTSKAIKNNEKMLEACLQSLRFILGEAVVAS